MAQTTAAPITRVGVDLAKNVIQVHAVDAPGRRVVARSIRREQFLNWSVQQLPQGCLVTMTGVQRRACLGAAAARRGSWMGG